MKAPCVATGGLYIFLHKAKAQFWPYCVMSIHWIISRTATGNCSGSAFSFLKKHILHFCFSLSLLRLFIEKIFLTSAPGRGVAAEEFCVFGDWGGSLNKPEKPERSGRFFANGAPYALLATFVERAIWRATCIACQIYLSKKFSQFVRQNAPVCNITLIERFFLIEKSSIGFWTF